MSFELRGSYWPFATVQTITHYRVNAQNIAAQTTDATMIVDTGSGADVTARTAMAKKSEVTAAPATIVDNGGTNYPFHPMQENSVAAKKPTALSTAQ